MLRVDAFQLQWPFLLTESDNSNSHLSDSRQVAITGAGIAGSSTAFSLHELSLRRSFISVTIYEAGPRVGGRVQSAYLYENPSHIVEIGAPGFNAEDWCMSKAVRGVGLKVKSALRTHIDIPLKHPFGVWDGGKFLPVEGDLEEKSWGILATLIWRYGIVPLWRVRNVEKESLKSYEQFGRRSYLYGDSFHDFGRELEM